MTDDGRRAYKIDGVDTFIAHGREGLAEAIREAYGMTWEEVTGDTLDSAKVEELPMDLELRIRDDPYDAEDQGETKTIREWIASTPGIGMLCSTEF